MADLSIIIVSWNARSFLLDCINSIKQQTAEFSREIIVVDNNSSDGSPQSVASDHPDVHLIQTGDNLGFARGNNVGIQAASGRYLFLINSDVVLAPGCLDGMARFLEERPRLGMAGPRVLNRDGSLQPSCRRFPSFGTLLCRTLALDTLFPNVAMFCGSVMRYWTHDAEREVDAISGCFMAVRRSAIEQVGGLDEGFFMYAEDVDWCKRFQEAGWGIALNPQAQITHFGGGSSANAPIRFSIELERAGLRYWRKHHGRLGRFCYRASLFARTALRLAARGVMYPLRPSKRAALAPKIRKDFSCIQWLCSSGTADRLLPNSAKARRA